MPDSSLEEAEKWVSEHIKDKAPSKPPKPEPVVIYDPSTPLRELDASLDDITEASPDLVNMVVALRNAGESQRRIAQQTGIAMSTISKIIRGHALTKDRDKAISTETWKDVRRLAADRLRDLLESDEAASRIKPVELATIAGIASDKLKDSETPAQIAINIKARVEAMSYEELINSIPKEPLDGFIAPLPPPPTPRPLPSFEPSGDESSPEDSDLENASDLQQDDE
jgi:transcriptional regulator with XRE-family HTH domain